MPAVGETKNYVLALIALPKCSVLFSHFVPFITFFVQMSSCSLKVSDNTQQKMKLVKTTIVKKDINTGKMNII